MSTTTFESFEQRDRYLRTQLRIPVHRRYEGPAAFYADFKDALDNFTYPNCALIAPNPLDYLPFDRVRLVLTASARLAGWAGAALDDELDAVISRYSLHDLTQRSIYTLSGGETLRLAMAKCDLEARAVRRLVVATSRGVLSDFYRNCLDRLVATYQADGRSHEFLLITGDDSDEQDGDNDFYNRGGTVRFRLALQSVEIPLSDAVGSRYQAVAVFDDYSSEELRSPCLIVGENGHGKSLLGKALTGAIPHKGSAALLGRKHDRVRLVFQDVSNQALLTSASIGWMLPRNPVARHLNEFLLRDTLHWLTKLGGGHEAGPSLLTTKIALIALRLSEKPAGLILDEPDWGLSKKQALALLNATSALCEQEDVPLLIISHRRWFDPLAGSRLRISRLSLDPDHKEYAIRISVRTEIS